MEADHPQVVVTEALRYGWVPEKQQSWVDLKIDNDNTLRLAFSDDFPPTLKICLQALQGHVAEERRKAGLPLIEHAYVDAIDRIEFATDEINQVAVIRTHYQNGGSRDTALEKNHIQPTIQFLKKALRAFEKLSKSSKH